MPLDSLCRSYFRSGVISRKKTVILVYPIPEVGWNVPAYAARLKAHSVGSTNDLTTSHQLFIERNKRAYEALDDIGEHPNLIRIKPENILCNTYVKGRCVAQIDGVPLYSDDDHLSNAGARLVVNEIMRYIVIK